MRVRYTIEFPDRYRRAINMAVGRRGLATRDECIAHLDMILDADAAELCSEMDAKDEARSLKRSR